MKYLIYLIFKYYPFNNLKTFNKKEKNNDNNNKKTTAKNKK